MNQSTPEMLTYTDLLQFENNNRYSSFGRMLLSSQKSAPKCKFGTANRDQPVYPGEEMAKTVYAGKHSPGPTYNINGTEALLYPQDPKVKIGTEKRKPLGSAKFDHYKRKDQDYNPHLADEARRTSAPRPRIGVAPRVYQIQSLIILTVLTTHETSIWSRPIV